MLTGNSNQLKFIISGDGSALQREIEKSQRTVTGFVDQLMGSFGRLGSVVKMASGLFAGGALLKYADDWGQLSSRVDIATGSMQAGADAMDRLMSMSSRVYKSIADTSELFIRTSGSLDQLGYSSDEALTMVEALSYGLVVSSATGEKTKSVIDAWSKSVLNGKMGLGEFQTVTAGAPRLLRAMADSLGLSERELLKFVASGQMTVDKLMLVTGEVEKLGAEADKMPTTVADAGTRLGNALTGWAGKFNEVTGATTKVTDGIDAISAGIQATGQVMADNKGVIGATLGALTGAGVAAGALAVGSAIMGAGGPMAAIAAVRLAFLALTATMAANPAGLVLLGVGAAAGVAIAANSANPQGDRLEKEISNQEKRLKEAEDLLARAGGPKGKMTERLEARIEGIKTYVSELKVQREAELGIETKATDAIAKLTKEEIKAAEIEQDLADIRRGLTGVSKDYLPTLEKLHKYFQEGRLTQEEYVAMVEDLAKANYKAEGSSKSGAAAVKALQGKYQELSKGILEKTEALTLELAIGSRVSESDKLRIKFQQDLQGSLKGLSAAQRAHIAVLIAEHEAQERAIKARKDAIKQYEQQLELEKLLAEEYVKQSKAREAMRTEVARANQELEDQEKRMALEVRLIGATTAARETGLAALDAEIELRKELDAINSNLDVDEPTRIEARTAAAARAARKIALAEQRVYVTEAEKTSQTISQTLQDYIMGGGKDAATYLKRLFATLVLQPVVQYGVQQGMNAIGLGGSGAGGAGGILGGGMPGGSFTDWSGLGANAGNWLIDQSTELAIKGFGSLSKSAFSLGDTIKGVDAWLKDVPGMSGGIGSALGYAGALYSLSQGNYGSAIGSAIGTWVLPGIGTMIGSTLGGLVDGMFGSNPHDHRGGVYSNATSDRNAVLKGLGLTSGPERSDFTSRGNQAVSTALGTTIDQLLGAYDTLAERATGAARDLSVYAGFATNPKDKDQNAYGYLRIFDAATQELLYKATHRNSSDKLGSDPAQAFNVFTGEIAGVLVQQLKAADLPGWMHNLFDSLGESVTLESYGAAVQQIALIDAGFLSLGQTMGMFSGLSGQMQTSLLEAFGSMEGLTATASSFYNSYYTEAERMETLAAQMQSALSGLNVQIDPRMGDIAKAQFKEAVEAAFAAGKGELGAQLLAMGASFAQVADYAQKATDSLRAGLIGLESNFAGGGLARQYQAEDAAKQIQSMLAGVGISKDAGALTQALMSATSADVEGYFREIWSALDTDAARQQLVGVAEAMLDLAAAAEAAAQAVAAEREGLEQRWLQATGNTAELRRRELEALDPSNRALLQMIYGLEDAKTSMTDLTNAAQTAAQKAAAAWQNWGTAAGLGATYLGDTSGLEARRAILGAQIAGSTDPADRLAKLQELISVEQAIGQAQQASRKTELEAINARQSALQKEVASAQQLLSAAQGLGSYVQSLRLGEASGLSEADRLGALGNEYTSLVGKARGGDADALQRLQNVAGDYLGLSQTLSASGSDYSVLAGRVSAELEAVSKAQELVAQSQVTGYEAQIAQLAQQSEYLSAQVELSDGTKSLIAKSMIDQAEAWDRENTQALTLQELQQRAVDSLALMPAGIASAIKPTIESSATYLANSLGGTVSSALGSLAGMLGMDGSHAAGLAFVPKDGYRAELHYGERVLTAEENRAYSAPQPFVMQATGIGTARLEALVERQTQYIAKLESRLAAIEANTGGLYDLTDQKSEGGNADRVELMNVETLAKAIAEKIKETA